MKRARALIFIVTAIASIAGADRSVAQLSCRPNILGGEDCYGPNGRHSTSSRNILGGEDVYDKSGKVLTCQRNIFGGQDCR